MPGTSNDSPKQVLAIVHGIRTRATWAEEIGKVIQEEAPNIVETKAIRWGHFGLFAFLLPFTHRMKPVRYVAEELRTLIDNARERDPNVELSILAHSYGTYIISKILQHRSYRTLKIYRVILCGSIIREDHPWHIADCQN